MIWAVYNVKISLISEFLTEIPMNSHSGQKWLSMGGASDLALERKVELRQARKQDMGGQRDVVRGSCTVNSVNDG